MDYYFAFYVSTFLIGYAYRMGFSVLDLEGMYGLLLEGVKNPPMGMKWP